jgi:hypothetical protein
MTDATLPAGRFSEGDFRVGHVLSQAWSVLWRNFPTFFVVTALAAMPKAVSGTVGDPFQLPQFVGIHVEGAGTLLSQVLSMLSEAAVLYGAFQDMSGRPVKLGESIRVGLRRFFPVVGVAISTSVLGYLGLFAFVVPGVVCFMMWSVAIPACVVERRGVFSSLRRSVDLTRGYRWKILGLMVLWWFADVIASEVVARLTSVVGAVPSFVVHAIWDGTWGAFYVICVVVAYHDLRVAKDGVDTAQIAAVFE